MNKYVKRLILFCILLITLKATVYADRYYTEPGSDTPYDFSAPESRDDVSLIAHSRPDSTPGTDPGNSNNSGSYYRRGGGTGGGGGGGGGGGKGNGIKKGGIAAVNHFIGPNKNTMLQTSVAEEGYTISTIREGANLGCLRVRNKNDKILYGFYRVKSAYSTTVCYYFFDYEAKIHPGFVADAMGDIYYFGSDGTMTIGKKVIKNVEYEFNQNGALLDTYVEKLKASREYIYCVNIGTWEQEAVSGNRKLLRKTYFNEPISYCKNEIVFWYNSATGGIEAYMFDGNGYLVVGNDYTFNGVTYSMSQDANMYGAIVKIAVPNANEYLSNQLYKSEIQIGNFIATKNIA